MTVSTQEKVVGALTYLTGGLVGFLWIVYSHIKSQRLSSFLKFSIFQSMFISIIIYVSGILLNILLAFAKIIPVIGALAVNIAYYLKSYHFIFGFSAINFLIIALSVYLAVLASLGVPGEVPWVSSNVRRL